MGAVREFKLAGDGIDWAAGRVSGHVAFGEVRRLRMSYRPVSMQSRRFTTELWAEGAPKLQIVSSSWKSLFEQEQQDNAYAAFVAELHRRLARAAPPARFERGSHPLLYWPGAVLSAGVVLAVAGLIARALQTGALSGAAVLAAFLAFYLWQAGNFFRRNRPGIYRPEAPPPELMPQG